MSAAKGWGRRPLRGHPGKFVYVVQFAYVDPAGKRRTWRQHAQIQSASGAASEAKRRMQLAMETGDPRGTDPGPEPKKAPTFEAFWAGYVQQVHLVRIGATPGTVARYCDIWRQVAPIIGAMRIDEFSMPAWQRFEATLMTRARVVKGKRVVGVQVRPFLNFVRGTLFGAAVEAGILKKADIPAFKTPKKPRKLASCPSAQDVAKLLEQPVTWIVVATAIAAFTSMRMGEIRALRRSDIDLSANKILIRRALSHDQEGPTKGKAERWVALHPRLRAVLEPWIARMLPLAFVVTNTKGKVPGRQAVLAAFKRLCRAAGVQEWSFHSVRHHVITSLLREGVAAGVVQRVAGHSNLRTTESYWHGAEDDAVTDAISRLPSGQS